MLTVVPYKSVVFLNHNLLSQIKKKKKKKFVVSYCCLSKRSNWPIMLLLSTRFYNTRSNALVQ